MALPSSAASEPHLAHFLAIPHTRAILDSPDYVVTSAFWRQQKNSTEDELLAVTLNTPTTISNLLALYRKPERGPDGKLGVQQMKLLVTFGNGVAGWPGIVHGGVTATLLDEFMGSLINIQRRERVAAGEDEATLPSASSMTAKLEVEYRAPIEVPGTHVITVEFEKRDGRKVWVTGRLEDKDGKVGARCRGLFVTTNKMHLSSPKPKL